MPVTAIKIKNKIGLHARPAALLASQGSKFKSEITVKKGNKEVNLKSVMGILSLGICCGDEIEIKTMGKDEEEAMKTIIKIIDGLED